jgi:hypothetical protein
MTRRPEQEFIPNLPANALIILDDACYHIVQTNKPHEKNTTKEWLDAGSIRSAEDATKFQLFEIFKLNKTIFKTFTVDNIFSRYGHLILHLPH